MDAYLTEEQLVQAAEKWKLDPFYAPETVTLGLDIGMEGIGIAVRKGQELIYCKTLLYSLPEAEALKKRRQFRASRHARKNRRVRMRRLQALFAKHGLPWVDDDIMSRSDPFLLRHRALKGTLASKEALSICIRSCVDLRGYDYYALKENGEYPWGEEPSLSDARKWVSSQFVDPEMGGYLVGLAPDLTFKNKELTEGQVAEWTQLVQDRASKSDEAGIPAMLAEYAHKHLNERRARGHNFPRSHVELHLRTILQRHAHLIDNAEAFSEALFLPCTTEKERRKAIFHYNRKTPKEARDHFNSKVKRCPYCEWLGISTERCGTNEDIWIRCWKMLDFLSNRTFETVLDKKPQPRATLPATCIHALLEALQQNPKITWSNAKKVLLDNLSPAKMTNSEWNKAQFEHLKDIVAPEAKVRKKRAGLSVAAAKEMCRLATDGGNDCSSAAIEAWKKESELYKHRQLIVAQSGIFPQVQMLLGTLKRKGMGKGQTFAATGQLQKIFAELNKSGKLNGKHVPDYCVVECIKNAAINQKQAKEIEVEQKKNREVREKLMKKYGLSKLSRADAYRIHLFAEQQVGDDGQAVCPFTGQKLGDNPLSTDLQLAHLYPDSRGGLYIKENLVLTTVKVNGDMNNRTPMEAAAAGLPGWLGKEEMLKSSKRFRWNENKRHLFTFVPTAEESFPDFNNMTRVSQLASSLRNLVAIWMGIAGDAEAIRTSIGNPSGTYTAAARRGMFPEFDKQRSNNLHHRIDAAVMSCIPPAGGINDVRYGGIFYTQRVGTHKDRRLTCVSGLPVPDFAALRRDAAECPILCPHSQSKYQSLGDSTFWGVDKDGKTYQRTLLKADSKDTPAQIRTALLDMVHNQKMGRGPREATSTGAKHRMQGDKLIPSEQEIQRWKLDAQAAFKDDDSVSVRPLCLTNGTPVRSYWKFGSKGNVDKSPLGWNGMLNNGVFEQLRNLSASNDRMELWLGWNARKKRWEYYKRLIPVASALAGLKRMGLPWRGRQGAPEYLIKVLDANKANDLRSMICGVLPPHAVKLGQFRKGDLFSMTFIRDDALVEKIKAKDKRFEMLDHPLTLRTWGKVSALMSNGQVEFRCVTHKDRKRNVPADACKLAHLIGLPASAEECARNRNMTPPA